MNLKRFFLKRFGIYSFSLFILLAFNYVVQAQTPTGYVVGKVIIDAGHGGKDPGALGTKRHDKTESDLALAVSLKLRDYILENYDNVEVVMTRSTDEFIELRERTRIANKEKAQLFISIHCNTNGNKKAVGAETYVIGMHKTEANMEVAKRENQVIFLEDDYQEHYEGFDPTSPESMIALSMMQNRYLEQSILFASYVQDQFRERVHRKDRGVKQAGYWVISHTIMPSVLIELGFISNNEEEDFLNSKNGQAYMASAIYRAFKNYKTIMEGVDTSKKKEEKKITEIVEDAVNDAENEPVKKEDSEVAGNPEDEIKQDAVKETVKPQSSKEKVDEGLNSRPGTVVLNQDEIKSKFTESDKPDLIFRVQIVSSSLKIAIKPENFKGLKGVIEYEKNSIYKYMAGSFQVFDDALEYQRELREGPYESAFIVAFYKGEQISLQKAFEIIRGQS